MTDVSEKIQTRRKPSRLKMMVIIILLPMFLCVIGWSSMKHEGTSFDEVAKIKAVCEGYRIGWLKNDPKMVLSVFTDDAVLLPHHGDPPIIGIAAMRNFWWPPDSPPVTVTSFTSTTDEVHSNGDMGYVWGKFSLSYYYEEKGQRKALSNAGTYVMIVRRQPNGAWLISHRMWDDPPARTQ